MFITEKQLSSKNNNFTLLRLIAASLILITHSYYVRQIGEKELLRHYTGIYSFSSFGMVMLFTMSGFLVCKSLVSNDSILQYVVNRFLRIWPAFAVCIILMILIEE